MLRYFKIIAIVIVLAFIATLFTFHHYYKKIYTTDIHKTRQSYVNIKKQESKDRVDLLVRYINNSKQKYKDDMKNRLRNRVYRIYRISYNIYNRYKNEKTEDEIKSIILNNIKNLELNDKEIFFFIATLNGRELYSPDKSLIGKNLLNNKHYSMAEEINIVKTKKEGFVKGFWLKKNHKQNRIAFVKLFEPFNWYIGAGDFIDNYKNNLENHITKELSNYRYGLNKHGYYFVAKLTKNIKKGRCFAIELVNSNNRKLVGKCLDKNRPDASGFLYRKKYLRDIKEKGYSFVKYSYKIPGTNKIGEKNSYITLYKPFNWLIGTGVCTSDVDFLLSNLKKSMAYNAKKDTYQSVLIFVFMILLIFILLFIFLKHSYRDINILYNFVEQYPNGKNSIKAIKMTEMKRLSHNIALSLEAKESYYRQLVGEKQRYEQLANNMLSCMIVVRRDDNVFKIVYANRSAYDFLNTKQEALIGKNIKDVFRESSHIVYDIENVYKNSSSKTDIEPHTAKCKEYYLSYHVYKLENGEIVIIARDTTKEYLLNEALKDSEEKFRIFAESVENGIFLLSARGKIVYANPAGKKFIRNSYNGLYLLKMVDDSYKTKVKNIFQKTLLSRNEKYRIDVKAKLDNSDIRWITLSFNKVYINKKPHVLIICLDVSEIYIQKEKLEYLSFHDSMTGIYNRRFFNEEIKRLFNERNQPLGLILMDLDGLKIINDVLGHKKGDYAIKVFVDVLQTLLRQNDLFARIGGDEFAIIATNTDEEGISNIIKRAVHIIDNKNKTLDIYIGFSYGFAIHEGQFESPEELFIEADKNLYSKKYSKDRQERLRKILNANLKTKHTTISKDISDYFIDR